MGALSKLAAAMKLGNLQIDPPVWMAPMAGVVDAPYRQLLRELGCPVVVTEMVSAEGILRLAKGSHRLLHHLPSERPLFVQLFGDLPERLAEAARLCAEMGFAGIDINMGCPVKKVVRHGAGAALMKDPIRAEQIVAAVRRAVSIPLTVKMRSAWSASEGNAIELGRRLAGAGADAIIIHARTRSQFYSGRADWELIGRAVAALDIPVIGNGDLRAVEDGKRRQTQTGCAGIMIGRAALGNPWLPAAMGKCMTQQTTTAYPPSPQERWGIFCNHLQKMIDWVDSERQAVIRMRKHLIWYTRGFVGAVGLRKEVHRMNTATAMRSAMAKLLAVEDRDPQCLC